MAQQLLACALGLPRLGKSPPLVDGRSQGVHTTRPLHAQVVSRPSHRITKTGQVTPGIWFVDGVLGVGPAIGLVDLGTSMLGQQRNERSLDEGGVGGARRQSARPRHQSLVYSGGDTDPGHATIMPHLP